MEASEQGRERAVTDRSESPETPQPTAPDLAPGEKRDEGGSQSERELPAEDQSPIASERDKAIVGDSGIFDQQPIAQAGSAADTPVRTSAPPPSMQSGMPLAEDRARASEEE